MASASLPDGTLAGSQSHHLLAKVTIVLHFKGCVQQLAAAILLETGSEMEKDTTKVSLVVDSVETSIR